MHECTDKEGHGVNSIFINQPRRASPEWSRRSEHGLSQLTDWFFNLDDYKQTHGFSKTFGYGHVSFKGLLLIRRSRGLDAMKRTRLRRRSDKVLADSNNVICVAFDDVHEEFKKRLKRFKVAVRNEQAPTSPSDSHPGKPDDSNL